MIQLLNHLGFQEVREVRRYDTFKGTSKERTARHYEVEGADFMAVWPG